MPPSRLLAVETVEKAAASGEAMIADATVVVGDSLTLEEVAKAVVDASPEETEALVGAFAEEEAASSGTAAATVTRTRKRDKLFAAVKKLAGKKVAKEETEELSFGEQLEAGWARRGSGSSLRRNVEVFVLVDRRHVVRME
jgi:hypothetical protein